MKRVLRLLLLGGMLGAFVFGTRFLIIGNTFEVRSEKGDEGAAEKNDRTEKIVKRIPKETPRQLPLENPPKIIRAIYLTAWSAGNPATIDNVIVRVKDSEINAVVIDIKDHTGVLSYRADIEEVNRMNAWESRIKDVNGVIKKLHDAGIYVIARITVFQDPMLTVWRPDLAIHDTRKISSSTPISSSTIWLDNHKAGWLDPAARPAWEYVAAIAKDASSRGFDELNFDYIRFPSDAGLQYTHFLSWDENTRRETAIRNFFSYLRQELPNVVISADVFGQTTVTYTSDMGIGQVLEDAYDYFDVTSPMLYPSHYVKNFLGLDNAAARPYEVVKFSMEHALKRLRNTATSTRERAKIRPWLQDFDLGGVPYTPEMVRAQIEATKDAMGASYAGYYLWDPSNTYTWSALKRESLQ
ncbi:MAG: putative glycoside hydrolase [Nanoarchaeota archaeon]|nr:putative glycoside hydrolase [Nanoarchaeota archaeon]